MGNGAYAANALKNPPNDATDIAAALKDAGFEVSLLKDADLTNFDKAASTFAANLKGADTGLFYYAGHGVAVDGMNYLIPVSPRIDDLASVKAKAVAIIAAQGAGSYAAILCRNLSLGGFSDWFLPSKDELNLMYTNLKKSGLGGFGSVWFWSSSQYYDYIFAWFQDFSDGVQLGTGGKLGKGAVRAVRAF